MPTPVSGQVGEVLAGPNATTNLPFRQMPTAEQAMSQVWPRYFELTRLGRVFSDGMTLTSIAASTFATGDLSATGKPITGVWNPLTNDKTLVILYATLGVTITAATNTGGGPYVWATSTGVSAISTGTAPLNRKTLLAAGSSAKGMSGIAMTGLPAASNLTVKFASTLCGGSSANFSFVGTAAGQATPQTTGVEYFEGGLLVPPGGIVGLFATTTPAAHSAASGIVWAEIPTTQIG